MTVCRADYRRTARLTNNTKISILLDRAAPSFIAMAVLMANVTASFLHYCTDFYYILKAMKVIHSPVQFINTTSTIHSSNKETMIQNSKDSNLLGHDTHVYCYTVIDVSEKPVSSECQ
jgi:hypothetical protein